MRANKMLSRILLAASAAIAISTTSYARTVTLDGRTPTIRLCPVTCISVSGHTFSAGSTINVLEVRSGWARLSEVLDAENLNRSFGERVPEQPAYWVDLSRTEGLSSGSGRTSAKKRTVSGQGWQKKRVTLPVARPSEAAASLSAAKDSAMMSALTQDSRETNRIVEAMIAKAEASNDLGATAASLPVNPGKRALSGERLTTDKMAAWLAANRGAVVHEAKESVSVAASPALKAPGNQDSTFGDVPDVMTSELLDKRLNILPGMNSNIPEETAIALRHYALGLLDSGTCKGIAGGGAGSTDGTIYLVCTDDLTQTREFSLKDDSRG